MITRVLAVDGRELHNCVDAGCAVSWDGYVIDPVRYNGEAGKDPATGEPYPELGEGDAAHNRQDVGDEWDTSTRGVARAKE